MSISLFWQSFLGVSTTAISSQTLAFTDAQAKVIETIEPNAIGRVQLHGVSWLARCSGTLLHPVAVGTQVQVMGRVGLILLIQPLAIPVTNVRQLPLRGYMHREVAV